MAAYKGFEGISWPNVLATLSLDQGLASLDELEAVRRYVDSLPRTARYEILHCSWVGGDATPASPSGFVSVGFDVGNYESEDSSYSAVLHELMFGKYSQLAEYRRRLNEDQLFWSIDDARGFLRRREHLIGEGFDLETDDNSESAVIHVAVAIR
ncbi:MAG TPA: hypothetical protein VI485_26115 [Vicinamibacterales bacterium]|nr:hypothetical protein [Vicinamibacterales bacterium]